MRKRILRWIRAQVREAKAGGVVLGVSGGIDSCVAAVLARQALGRERVLALLLPVRSDPDDLRDARLLVRKFGIRSRLLDASGIYDRLIQALPPAGRLARSNLKPRLRMLILYYYANKLNYLVMGTSNKAERMIGYFTKFGDGAADILPLAGLLKAHVRSLAVELGIPGRIIAKVPTAGLWPGQTDEGEMGIPYADLDRILAQPTKAGGPMKARVQRMIHGSRHKRSGPKVCSL